MMLKRNLSRRKNDRGFRAQAIVEFAIALPILLAILVGIFEVGRMVFIYAAVTNASRNAVRYASAVGREDKYGLTKYNYCHGIYQAAKDSAFLVRDITVEISYDDGNGNPLSHPECVVSDLTDPTLVDTGVTVSSGDRVEVIVTAEYKPMVKLIPFPTRDIEAKSLRTILGIYKLGS